MENTPPWRPRWNTPRKTTQQVGGREYKDVYGPDGIYAHYLTGSSEPSSLADQWIARGNTLDFSRDKKLFVLEASGYSPNSGVPPEVQSEVIDKGRTIYCREEGTGLLVRWELSYLRDNRGAASKIIDNPNKVTWIDLEKVHVSVVGRNIGEALELMFRDEGPTKNLRWSITYDLPSTTREDLLFGEVEPQ